MRNWHKNQIALIFLWALEMFLLIWIIYLFLNRYWGLRISWTMAEKQIQSQLLVTSSLEGSSVGGYHLDCETPHMACLQFHFWRCKRSQCPPAQVEMRCHHCRFCTPLTAKPCKSVGIRMAAATSYASHSLGVAQSWFKWNKMIPITSK